MMFLLAASDTEQYWQSRLLYVFLIIIKYLEGVPE